MCIRGQNSIITYFKMFLQHFELEFLKLGINFKLIHQILIEQLLNFNQGAFHHPPFQVVNHL